MTRRTDRTAATCALALALLVWGTPADAGAAGTTATPVQRAGSTPGQAWPALGESGAAVKRLQHALIAAGVGVAGGVDGAFGPATARSVRTYQSATGLEATGRLDDATAVALDLRLPRLGDSGAAVARLQEALLAAGVDVRGGADGWFGAHTAAAVAAFQRAGGLDATGVPDAAMALRLGLAPRPRSVTASASTSASSASTSASGSGGSTARRGPAVQIEVFPVQGHCGYRDGWMAPRPGGRRHIGVDIIAPELNYVYAVVDGVVTQRLWDYAGRTSGNALKLETLDGTGTYFFYGHLFDFVPGVRTGTRVRAGQIIGFVGATGLAGTSHLHFEVHPGGGDAVNPYPIVKAVDACDVTTPGPRAYG